MNSVKKNDLTKSITVALLLVSVAASAEDKYPASDFQPKVVYQDESATKPSTSSASSASTSSSKSSSASDPNYPAADFQPKVLYSDDGYKHGASTPKSNYMADSASGSASSTLTSSTDGAAVAATEESSTGYLFGLIALAGAGFFLFKKGAGASKTPRSAAGGVSKNAGGLTGVARYVLKASGTGVSRYLEKQAKTVSSSNSSVAAGVTGVAKYLESKGSSVQSAAKEAVTGVEKYMRNKG